MSAAASTPSTSTSDSSLSDYGYGRGADVANEGYKGHLSSAQKEIYDQFRAAMPGIEEKAKADHLAAHPEDAGKFDKPAAYQVGPDHKEYTALRFLRARKFDLKAATEMYTKHMSWRYLHDVDHILCPDTRVPKADLVAKLVPHVMHGWDKSGRPVFFEKPGKVEVKTVTALVSEKEYLLNHIAKMENHLRVATEQAAKTGRHCETFTLVLDLTGVKLAASNTGYLAQCSENDTNNYPECLGQLIIINAPWIFPVFWKLASPFVDKRTKSKITIVYGKYEETLRSIMDEDQIPACYGGKCTAHKDQTGGCLPETDLKELKLSDVAGDVNEDAELKEITVAAGKRYEEKHELKKGASVHWYFRLENADVSFSVTFHAADAKPETVLAPVRTHTHQGSHRATTDGHVIILFDNHHSYFKSKTVRYSGMLMEPNADAHVPEGTQETPRIHDEE